MRNRLSPIQSDPTYREAVKANYDHKSIQLRRGTSSEWADFGEKCFPLAGEMCVEFHQKPDGSRDGRVSVKIGNGQDPWNNLPYLITDSDHPAFDLTEEDIEAIKNGVGAGLVISETEPTENLKEGLMWLHGITGDLYVLDFDTADNVVWFEFPATGISADGTLIPYGATGRAGPVYTDQVLLRVPEKAALTQKDANEYIYERLESLEAGGSLETIDGGTYTRSRR